MATIVIITSEMAGRINISAELSRRLSAVGHRVVVASPADIGEAVAARGATFVRLTPRDLPATAPSGRRRTGLSGRFPAGLRRLATVGLRRDAAVLAMDPEGFLDTMRRLDPDLTLIDIELPMHIMATVGSARPAALWTSMLSVWKRPGLPPLHTAIVPGVGAAGSTAGIAWAWLRFRIGKWLARRRRFVAQAGADRVSVLRRVADHTGFPFRTEASLNDWLVPVTYRSLPTLMFNARELEFPHDPHPSSRYVGPVLNDSVPSSAPAATLQALAELYGRRQRGDSAALIYCSFGAWHKGDDADFFLRVISAAAAHPEWDVVIALGGRLDTATLGETPPNVHVFDWAPQFDILHHADVAVHHAGISSVNECITAGVPMVVYPFDFLDQLGNAARVEFHGIGVVGDRTTDTPAMIRSRIEKVLIDRDTAAAMDRMRNAFATYQAENRAVTAIEALLRPAES